MRWFVHSQMRNIPSLGKHRPDNIAELNPETASTYGLEDGEPVRPESPRGAIQCELKVADKIRPRVVQLYHGYSKANASILTDNSVFDLMTGSAPMRSRLCKIEKSKTV
jgi:anaerobic selenocysteine-containing dehydrogenase